MLKDRKLYLQVIDAAMLAKIASHNKSVEAETLDKMYHECIENRDHMQAQIIMQKHSSALHLMSQYEGQYTAYIATASYLARAGYQVV
jgi:hypothetical protein